MTDPKGIRPNWRRVALVLAPIIIGAALFFFMGRLKQPPRQKKTVSKAPVVRIIPVTPMDVLPRAYGYGTAAPIRVWKAIAQVSGKIVQSSPQLKKGKQVRKGTVLLRIDPSEYRIAISQLKTKIESYRIQVDELDVQRRNNLDLLEIQQQTLRIKKKEVARQKKLFEQKMVSANEYENQLQGLMSQQAQVQSIQNSLNLIPHQRGQLQAQIEQAEGDLSNARLQLSYTVIKAPFDVQIASVNNESSEFIQKGQTIFIANDVSASEIEAQFIPGSARPVFLSLREQIETSDFNGLDFNNNLGVSAVVRMPGDFMKRHTWPATLSRFSNTMDTETRTMGLIFVVKNRLNLDPGKNQRPIFSGMYCEVELRGKIIENALVIPRDAIHPGNIVYVMTAGQTLEKRKIEPGVPIENFVMARKGLNKGDLLILSDVIPAVSGMKVSPIRDTEALEQLKRSAKGAQP